METVCLEVSGWVWLFEQMRVRSVGMMERLLDFMGAWWRKRAMEMVALVLEATAWTRFMFETPWLEIPMIASLTAMCGKVNTPEAVRIHLGIRTVLFNLVLRSLECHEELPWCNRRSCVLVIPWRVSQKSLFVVVLGM